MKKYLGALLAGGMVFGLVMGSAAALDIDNVDPLQVGVTLEGALECDPDGVDVQPGFAEQGTNVGQNPAAVRESWAVIISGINVVDDTVDGSCEGANLVAIALDEDGNTLSSTATTSAVDVIGATGTETLQWDHKVDPLDIHGIELHISG